MIDDFILRSAAVVAAVAVVAGPSLVAYAKKIVPSGKASAQPAQNQGGVTPDDAHTVVEIARRLAKSGNTKGADLCKQLLDVLLSSERKAP